MAYVLIALFFEAYIWTTENLKKIIKLKIGNGNWASVHANSRHTGSCHIKWILSEIFTHVLNIFIMFSVFQGCLTSSFDIIYIDNGVMSAHR